MSKIAKWLFLEAVLPLGLPIILAVAILGLRLSGEPTLEINWNRVFDLAPWTLLFFSLTLVVSSLRKLKVISEAEKVIFYSLIVAVAAVSTYLAFLITWRQDGDWTPNASVWWVSAGLSGLVIALCCWIDSSGRT